KCPDEAVTDEVEDNAATGQSVDSGDDLLFAANEVGAMEPEDTPTVTGAAVSTVEVPANGTTTLDVTIDVSAVDGELSEQFTNGYGLEGFVTVTDPHDTHPELHVPYVGFKGEWESAAIIDSPLWDDDSYYEMTGVVASAGEDENGDTEYDFLGEDTQTGDIDPDHIAFSPDGDGVQDDALLVLSFLRNAKEVKFNVLDENKEKVRTITTESH